MSDKFEKLKVLLRELFQLDQPDLDFGLYRIMHAKSAEVSQFLDKDLLPQIKQAFGMYKTSDKADLEKELQKVVAGIQAADMDPEQSPKVKDLRAKLANDAVDIGELESEVYDHLFNFFRRYYSEGDFLAKRVYRSGVYAIPYEGEEVKLHWANQDQYYIKTSEYLRDYTFRLRPDDAKAPMRVHFRLVDAAEDEHGNVKAADGRDRVFVLAAQDFIAEEGGDLILHFAYRPATLSDWPPRERDGKKKPPAQKDLTTLAVSGIMAVSDVNFAPWIAELAKPHVNLNGDAPGHTSLEGHLKRYTARNTFDYFIHKDLGAFLRRELDFYIKNEVMHLDDIESDTVPRVEQYLSKIKAIRRIAAKLIDFLAQLEDFQKKLWLKKKFVVETRYCIKLDQVPVEFYPEIASSDAQREEWVRLLAIDEISGDLTSDAYSVPLTIDFLKQHPTLGLDTHYLDPELASRILQSIGNIGDLTDGVVLHSENFQALSLMQAMYRDTVKSIYIDPPYNTGGDGFAYRDSYQHSSWMSLIADRIRLARTLMTESAGGACNLNDIEDWRMRGLIAAEFGHDAYVTTVITKCSTPSSFRTVNVGPVDVTDRIIIFARDRAAYSFTAQPVEKPVDLQHFSRFVVNIDSPPEQWIFKSIRLQVLHDFGFACESSSEGMKLARAKWADAAQGVVDTSCELFALQNAERVFELKTLQKPSPWIRDAIAASRAQKERIFRVERAGGEPIYLMGGRQFYFLIKGVVEIRGKRRLTEPASTLWTDIDTNNLRHEGDVEFPAGKKPLKLVERLMRMSEEAAGSWHLDFFAGSGTTAHAVVNLNREDGGRRRFILVEAGDYFDTVLLSRIKKIGYSPEWNNSKPARFASQEETDRSPRIIKIVRLESYEDTLNNLTLNRKVQQTDLLASAEAQGNNGFKEQYLLRYLLDVDTRGSQSLLNTRAFGDPTAYKLKVKRPGSDQSREVNVDLLETFNWLIGLTVQSIAAPQTFFAEFERDAEGRLVLGGRLRQDAGGPWWFRTVTGTTPDGRRTLIIWRKLAGNAEQDNLVLDTWFTRAGYSAKDSEFGLIYVNGDNNLENLKAADDTWKVRLIEEDFHRLMFDTEGL